MNSKYDLSNIDNEIDIFSDKNDNNDNNLLAIFSQKIFQKHIEQYKVKSLLEYVGLRKIW